MLLSTPLSSYVKTHKNCYCRAIFILIALVIIALVCKTISVNNKKYVESLQNQDAYLLAKSGLEKALTDYLSDTFFAPVTMLSVLTLSVAVMAYLFFYQPLQLFIEGKKKQAVNLFVKTVGIFAVLTTVTLILLFSGIV